MPIALVAVYPGCSFGEVVPTLQVLDGRFEVRVTAPRRAPVRTTEGFTLVPDQTFDEATTNAREVALLLVPGGDVAALLTDPSWATLVSACEGACRAGICNGAFALGLAGALDGRRATHMAIERYAPRPTFDPLLELADRHLGAVTYVDEDVVVDGRLITAKPWSALAFARAVAVVTGSTDDDAERRVAYLSGNRNGAARAPMLHHLSLGVTDVARAARFYDAALAPLGYVRVWSDLRPGETRQAVGYGEPGGGDRLALKQVDTVTPCAGTHLAFGASSRAAVDAFHAAALAAGGIDEGAPGLRVHYGPDYYAAFVLDPDGHRLEAVHKP
jgi:catechol 2,3-dioxygenase-like lactoylglutathione lyase family enzyme